LGCYLILFLLSTFFIPDCNLDVFYLNVLQRFGYGFVGDFKALTYEVTR